MVNNLNEGAGSGPTGVGLIDVEVPEISVYSSVRLQDSLVRNCPYDKLRHMVSGSRGHVTKVRSGRSTFFVVVLPSGRLELGMIWYYYLLFLPTT